MADPTVHITNGIPDLGTGNITTLGMTLLDGANITIGATTDAAIVAGAAGTINAHLRSISRDIVNGIVLSTGANVIGSVMQAGAPWSQNVSQFGGNAVVTGVGISGLGIPRVTVSSDSSMAVTQSGTWNINSVTTLPLPSGASTAAKQPALGTAGVPSADVITVQGVSGGTAQLVTGTGGTFPVTGTLAVTQSGTWNITNVSGTVSLPTGAATAAKQPALGVAGTPSTDVLTIQGASTMTPLKSNIFGSSGTVLDFAGQAAASPANSLQVGGQYNTTPTTLTTGTSSPLQLDANGNLKVNIITGAGSGGTSSTAGATTPTVGTMIMGGATTAAPSYTTGTANPLSLDTSGNLRVVITPTTFTVTQATAASLNATVTGTVAATQSGTWNITNITGTVSLPTGAATSANQCTAAGQGSTTSGQTGNLAMGAVLTAAPTYTTAQTSPLSLTTAGALRVDPSGVTQPVSIAAAVSVNPGTITNWGLSPSTYNNAVPTNGMLVEGQFLTSPGAMTSGNTSPLQLDANANLRVNIMTGTVAATQSGSWTLVRGYSAASAGLTYTRVVAAASTNATSVKTSAGNIVGLDLFNVAAYMVFLKLYNKASAPTVGTDTPVWTIPIPAGGGFSMDESASEYFSTGIAFAITKLQADTDTTAVAAGDVTGRVKWI